MTIYHVIVSQGDYYEKIYYKLDMYGNVIILLIEDLWDYFEFEPLPPLIEFTPERIL